MSGFFTLKTPRDLLDKAGNDLARLRKNQLDVYSAFDFFVTVRHIPDWLYPEDGDLHRTKRKDLFNSYGELRVARQLADGAKHFIATHAQHTQVSGTSVTAGAFQGFVFQDDSFQTPGMLIVHLDEREREALGLGAAVDAVTLAEKVFEIVTQFVAERER
jgi:hypothetical protein